MSSSNCFFHISNVKASSEKPFEIKVDSTIVFSSTEDIDKKTVTHDIPIPKFASVHNVYMNILAPLNGLDELERYNLSNKGTHFIIDPTRSSNPVKQCFDESGSTQSPSLNTTNTSGSASPRALTPTKKTTATSTSSILGVKSTVKSSPTTTTSSTASSSSQATNSPRQPTTTSNIRVPVSSVKPTTESQSTSSTTPRQTGDLSGRGEVSFESVFDGVGNAETTLTFWLYGVEASVRYPFRILIDGFCLFRCEHDAEKTKVQIKVKEPKFSPEHKINLSVDMPMKTGVTNQDVKRIVNEKRYNLSASGKFFLIDFAKKEDSTQYAKVIQSTIESFSGYEQPELYEENKFEKRNDDSTPAVQTTISSTPLVFDEYQVDASNLTAEQREKLLKVQSLEDKGILDKAEADFERKNIIGDNKLLSFPKKTQTVDEKQPEKQPEPVKQPEPEIQKVKTPRQETSTVKQPEFIELKLFLCNIKASSSQPFQLIYKPENAVMISLTEDVSPEKIICVKGEIPSNPSGDTIAPLVIDMPKVGVKLEHSLNLKNGRFAMIGVSDNTAGKVVCRQQNDENFEGFIQDSGPKEEPSKILVHFSGIPASTEQPFLIYINDKQAYKREEPLKKRQKGCINGDIPKNKRINPDSEANHVVSVKVEAPMVSPNAKVVAVDLTNNGTHVFVSCNQETNEIIIKQGHEENSKEEDLRVCEEVGANKSISSAPQTEQPSAGKKLTEQDIELLKKLADLKNAGILTETEYELKKKDILFGN
ncbi:hypothetical protein NAEGRDRAFT_57644 [Naegleria gruberi]|uniref:SHOCT domain-containing protein n=1 Tax=Naegleria gruberi TaxID=5762 RepID=D2VAN9_NAEGR|nr:uncharacterized protein NAEGRDRAFT_57644 [Naegleria gruberi]EFC45987.1 hypothetical protein NAEGRDRAFT_57644 [Naegleria gruberi]|eukprot:XP_002678731.1 hypothetical protein NAEGRDRAFT_57644 [Naegleria gruberi strain NEG-M]